MSQASLKIHLNVKMQSEQYVQNKCKMNQYFVLVQAKSALTKELP